MQTRPRDNIYILLMATKLAYDEKASPTKPTSGELDFSGSNLVTNREKQDRKQRAPEYTCIKSKGRVVILVSNY